MKNNIIYFLLLVTLTASTCLYACSQQYKIPDSSSNEIEFSKDNELIVTFLDVGKADCIIIQDSESVIMIDTAEEENYSEINAFLEQAQIEEIDYLIITHYDKDHVGGAAKLLSNYPIKNIIQPNYEKETQYVEAYQTALERANMEAVTLKENTIIDLPDYQLTLLPSEIYYEDGNNNSIISTINYDGNHLLFMGDAKDERIAEFLDFNTSTYDLIKMPHHGNYQGLTEDLIQETYPRLAVITCSNKNPAEEETLDILESYQVKTYQTNDGNVTISYEATAPVN